MVLEDEVEKIFRLSSRQKNGLKNLGIKTISDLVFYFPFRYETFSQRKNICDLREGDKTTIYGEIFDINMEKTWRKKINITEATIRDQTGEIKSIWFHQPYIANILKNGDKVALTGKINSSKNGLYISNPTYEKIYSYEELGEGGAILAVYPETKGVSSRWLRYAIQRILKEIKEFPSDPLPNEILKKYHLPTLKSSLFFIHTPKKLKDAEAARKRFSFEEIFFIQLNRLKQKKEIEKRKSFSLKISTEEIKKFLNIFPFKFTNAQKKAIWHIIKDFEKNKPMCRLLEGDVGSGKTAVAVVASYIVVKNNLQVAYMAPTEILAEQHFQSFINYFSLAKMPIQIGLITSSICKKFPSKINPKVPTNISKNQLLKWLKNGEISILIGTHSLIQNKVKFSQSNGRGLGLVIIDEQHRFGVNQRSILARGKTEEDTPLPHLLSMTATPIPRTLALTIYGDLDLTLLDEMPKDRKEIITKIVGPQNRNSAYEKIREELRNGRQAYVICPRIEEPNKEKEIALAAKAVKKEAEMLRKDIFPEFEIGILHGKLLPKEKEKILNDFRQKKIHILVSTSVIEVGIDIPNATVIMIEGAERFGLAQLHQLRGRVARSSFQAYCFVLTESNSPKALQRLKALASAKNGFELAEYDLQLRGPGELTGLRQWGISDIGMEALKNIKMVEAARIESQKILEKDPELKKYPLFLERIKRQEKIIHFE